MKSGCFGNAAFALLLLLCFALSSYFWFGLFVRGKSLPTPKLIGLAVSDARKLCSDLGVTLEVDEAHQRNSDKVAAGNIVWQNRTPGATSFIKRGSAIRVELSAGPLILAVPDLKGQRPGTAMLRLGQLNLRTANMSYADTGGEGIIAADPPAGTVVAAQTPVSLLISTPPAQPTFVMPDLIDKQLDVVRPRLEASGLAVSTVKFESYPGIPDGIIIRQYPLRGSPVNSREAVSVVVSKQAETGIIEQRMPVMPPAPLHP